LEPIHDSLKTPLASDKEASSDSNPAPPPPPHKAKTPLFDIPVIVEEEMEDFALPDDRKAVGVPSYQETNDDIMIMTDKGAEGNIDFDQDEDKVYEVVDEMPEFLPKGQLASFIADNLVYPDNAKDAGFVGAVNIGFVVEKDGRITNISILNSSNVAELDVEAILVVKKMPRFAPGKINGKAVRCRIKLPITIYLEDK
jgi:protein TonB